MISDEIDQLEIDMCWRRQLSLQNRSIILGHTPKGSCDNTLLRMALRRFFEKVLRRVLRRCLAAGLRGRNVS